VKLSFLLGLLFFVGGASAAPGQLVSVFHFPNDTSADQVDMYRHAMCPAMVGYKKTMGFKRYRIEYKTTDLKGHEVTSAGIMIVPETQGDYPLFVYQHGTLMGREELPSSNPQMAEGDAIGACFSSMGYVSISADYLGYGDGTGVHPYLHAASEAWTARDMMRAVQAAVTQLNYALNGKIFIAGYSQGGHAALALLRALEQDPAHEFKVTAAAPMAGPYAISSSLGEIAGSPSDSSSAEAAFLLVGLNQIYPLYKDVNEAFVPRFAPMVESLFDGTHNSQDVLKALNVKPTDMIQPAYLRDAVMNPAAPLMVALKANDVYEWTPVTPIHFYHGHGDHEVPYSNSEKAYGYMKAQGAQVELIDLGKDVDHGAGFPLAIGQAALWFDSF
jgi:predicted esterase